VKLQDGAPGGGLAAAGFAHQPQGFALVDIERDVIHCVDSAHLLHEDDSALDGEMLDKIFYAQ